MEAGEHDGVYQLLHFGQRPVIGPKSKHHAALLVLLGQHFARVFQQVDQIGDSGWLHPPKVQTKPVNADIIA